METVRDCPFCGTDDIEVYPASRKRDIWRVHCGNPDCVTRDERTLASEAEAVAAWNTRADDRYTITDAGRAALGGGD